MSKLRVGQAVINVDGVISFDSIPRPNFGRLGRKITVIANLYKFPFLIGIFPDMVYHYVAKCVNNVVVKHDKVLKPACRKIMEAWKNMDHSATLDWASKDRENAQYSKQLFDLKSLTF
ncbi:hypothetical protein HK099_001170 [Clydaea vesicula]|uniref:Uncharacterized protein n=1 Tax=Clydaea vesicula TaxID=447962 RepID=A0AAD5TYP9_9FUNG|nr:hypothetical protein HK099_001170 [Clydaea vesicula]